MVELIRSGERVDCIPGYVQMHMPFGLHRIFRMDNIKYIVFIREPVARTISALQHCIWLTPHKQSYVKEYYDNANDVYEFLEKCIENETNCNVMTKQLSGMEDFDDIVFTEQEAVEGEIYSPRHKNKRKYREEEMRVFLENAKKNLKNCYDFVGFQETFSRDIKKLCKRYNLSLKRWQKHNITNINQISAKDERVRELISQMNLFDLQLYEYAWKRSVQ